MKARICGVLTGIVVLSLLAATVSACGGAAKTAASTPTASTAVTAVVTTLAGKADSPPTTVDGSGAAARFVWPHGITIDAAGNLYVTDVFTVRKITPAGQVTTLAGDVGVHGTTDGSGAAARFMSLYGIVRDAAGNLYVTDRYTVRKITPAGRVTTFAGKARAPGSADGIGASARFGGPGGITIDPRGNLYVTDVRNDTIRKITPAGKVTTIAGKTGVTGTADGRAAAARFNWLAGITIDPLGNLYVVDNGASVIRKITPAGRVTTLAAKFGSPGGADGSGNITGLVTPSAITRDAAGNLYVIDDETINMITPTGQVTTLAGKLFVKSSADGSGAQARFKEPGGIVCDAAGNLYVADSTNCTIRKITLSH